ncbi:MAG TPA: AMP-dependent synthetase/ligase [Streptosporangiaceae bacterium]
MNVAHQPSAIDQALTQPSLSAAFLAQAAASPGRVALRAFGSPRQLTLGEWSARATAVAGGLVRLGVRPGDRVALLLGTRMEFHIADMGAMLAGAVPFSLYVTSPVSQLEEIIGNAQPCVLITEASLAGKARELARACPVIEHLVVVEADAAGRGELSLAGREALSPDGFDVRATATPAGRDDICTLVYTSGTTGPPKGVQFRHGGMLDCLDSIRQRFATTERDRAISYLPMAHVAERIFGHYAAFVYGYEVTSLADLSQLGAALREIRPTRFFGVPRIYEKLLAGLHQALAAAPERDRLQAALASRLSRVQAQQAEWAGAAAVPGTGAAIDDDRSCLELLRPLAALTGLEQAHFLAVAGAPSSPEMLAELTAFGLPINEFYGSSETIIVTCSPPDRIRLGTVGTPLAGARLRLGEDGEILIAGPTITPGYYRDPERTAEALEPGGWFHTGDIGALDDDGYLRIVDRKKALIINSFGKNMSPANIEQAVKGGQPMISQVLVVGDRRPYNVALIVLDRDGAAAFAREHDLGDTAFEKLTGHPEVLGAVAAAVAAGNQRLSRPEQIRRYQVLDHDWPLGGEQLTPTAKVRRAEVAAQYQAVIDGLYE